MTLSPEVCTKIECVTRLTPLRASPLGGGCVSQVERITLQDGSSIVAKIGAPGSGLEIEAFMLGYLAENSRLPVPRVLHAEDGLLLMSDVETDGDITAQVESHAAELLADLHAITADAYGFERSTLIGGLDQPNHWQPSWLGFFRDQRLLFMARSALDAGRLPPGTMSRIETVASRLPRWIDELAAPSLIHGDMWTGNVLRRRGRVAAFIDPAIYFADAEIELAFSTLFATFGDAFFDAYRAHRPIREGFFEVRRDLYNLYPLLVHVRLFGNAYLGSVERILTRLGA